MRKRDILILIILFSMVFLVLSCGQDSSDKDSKSSFKALSGPTATNQVKMTINESTCSYSTDIEQINPKILSSNSLTVKICAGDDIEQIKIYVNDTLRDTATDVDSYTKTFSGILVPGNNIVKYMAKIDSSWMSGEQGLIYQPTTHSITGSKILAGMNVSIGNEPIDDGNHSYTDYSEGTQYPDDLMTYFLKKVNSFDVQDFIDEYVNPRMPHKKDDSGNTRWEYRIELKDSDFGIANNSGMSFSNGKLKLALGGDSHISTTVDIYAKYKHRECWTVLGEKVCGPWVPNLNANPEFEVDLNISGSLYASYDNSNGKVSITGDVDIENLEVEISGLGGVFDWIANEVIDLADLEDYAEDAANEYLNKEIEDMIEKTFESFAEQFFKNLKYNAQQSFVSNYPGYSGTVPITYTGSNLDIKIAGGYLSGSSDVSITSAAVNIPAFGNYKSFIYPTDKNDLLIRSKDLYAMGRHAMLNKVINTQWKTGIFYKTVDIDTPPFNYTTISFRNTPIVFDKNDGHKNFFFGSNIIIEGQLDGYGAITLLLTMQKDNLPLQNYSNKYLALPMDSSTDLFEFKCDIINAPEYFYSLDKNCVELINEESTNGSGSIVQHITDMVVRSLIIEIPSFPIYKIEEEIPDEFNRFFSYHIPYNLNLMFNNITNTIDTYYPVGNTPNPYDRGELISGDAIYDVENFETDYPYLNVYYVDKENVPGGDTKIKFKKIKVKISNFNPYNTKDCESVILKIDDTNLLKQPEPFFIPEGRSFIFGEDKLKDLSFEIQTEMPKKITAQLTGCSEDSNFALVRDFFVDNYSIEFNFNESAYGEGSDKNYSLKSISFDTKLDNGIWNNGRKLKIELTRHHAEFVACPDEIEEDDTTWTYNYTNPSTQDSVDPLTPEYSSVKHRTLNINNVNFVSHEKNVETFRVKFYDEPTHRLMGSGYFVLTTALILIPDFCDDRPPKPLNLTAKLRNNVDILQAIAETDIILEGVKERIKDSLDWFRWPDDLFINNDTFIESVTVDFDNLLMDEINQGKVVFNKDILNLVISENFIKSFDFNNNYKTKSLGKIVKESFMGGFSELKNDLNTDIVQSFKTSFIINNNHLSY